MGWQLKTLNEQKGKTSIVGIITKLLKNINHDLINMYKLSRQTLVSEYLTNYTDIKLQVFSSFNSYLCGRINMKTFRFEIKYTKRVRLWYHYHRNLRDGYY